MHHVVPVPSEHWYLPSIQEVGIGAVPDLLGDGGALVEVHSHPLLLRALARKYVRCRRLLDVRHTVKNLQGNKMRRWAPEGNRPIAMTTNKNAVTRTRDQCSAHINNVTCIP
jgi:hypothetical protein